MIVVFFCGALLGAAVTAIIAVALHRLSVREKIVEDKAVFNRPPYYWE